MRSTEGSRRIHALFRTMEGRNHPFRSARYARMSATHPTRRALPRRADNRKRERTAMRILPRPIKALILIAVAAGAYGGYERLRHRQPPRVAEAPKTAVQPPMPPAPPVAVAAARAAL